MLNPVSMPPPFQPPSLALVPSGVAVICQKGRVGGALARIAREAGYALHRVVEGGAGPVLDVAGYLSELAEDPAIRVIALCLDEVADGAGFVAALKTVRSAGKRLVVLKGGQSAGTSTAPRLEHPIWRAMLARHGAILAESHCELIDIALFLGVRDRPGLPRGEGLAIVTGGGGNGVNAADLCARHGFAVPQPAEETRDALRRLVPPIASIGNPFDLTPEMGSAKYSGNYPAVLDRIAADPRVDTMFFPINALSRARSAYVGVLADFRRRDTVDLLIAFNMLQPEAVAELAAARAYNFVDPERGVRAFDRMTFCARAEDEAAFAPAERVPEPDDIGESGETLLRHGLEQAGIPLAPRTVQRADARSLAFRFAGFRHPVFGPVVCCEAGGEFFGLMEDHALAAAPFGFEYARALVAGLAVAKSAAKIDRSADPELAARALAGFSSAIATLPTGPVVTIDPLVVGAHSVLVLDGFVENLD